MKQNELYSADQLDLIWLFSSVVPQYDDDGNKIPRAVASEINDATAFKTLNSPEHKTQALKCNMKNRILNRVEKMVNPYFFTITMNDKTLNEKDYCRVIRRTLKEIGIKKYVLITDYGDDNDRLHYHGYLDLVDCPETEIIKSPTKKYHNGIQLKRFTNNIGWNLGTTLQNSKLSIRKTCAYTLKYMIKDGKHNFKHKMFCSRESKNDKYNNLPF